jgi:CTP:molybdopterin cytidylyltransferase MocA
MANLRIVEAASEQIADALSRKPHKQVIQQNLRPVLHREPREPVSASALAGVAAKPDEHVGEVQKATDAH